MKPQANPAQQLPNPVTLAHRLPPELQTSSRRAEQGMLMEFLETHSVVAPPLRRIAVPLVVGPNPICFQTKRIQVPRALKVLLVLEEVSIDGGRRVFAGMRGRLLTLGVEGGIRGDRCSGTRARSVRLATSSFPRSQLRPVPPTSPLRHPRLLRLSSTLTLFLAFALGRRYQQTTIDRAGMGTATSLVRPRAPITDRAGMTRLPTARLTARHA